MKLVMVAVRDSALDAFMRPFFVPTTGVAIRSFQDACKQEPAFKDHPTDFTLYELGEFDEETGKCSNLEAPRQLLRGQDIKEIT